MEIDGLKLFCWLIGYIAVHILATEGVWPHKICMFIIHGFNCKDKY